MDTMETTSPVRRPVSPPAMACLRRRDPAGRVTTRLPWPGGEEPYFPGAPASWTAALPSCPGSPPGSAPRPAAGGQPPPSSRHVCTPGHEDTRLRATSRLVSLPPASTSVAYPRECQSTYRSEARVTNYNCHHLCVHIP